MRRISSRWRFACRRRVDMTRCELSLAGSEFLPSLNDAVNQSIVDRLFGRQPVIPGDVLQYDVDRLSRLTRDQFGDAPARQHDFPRLDGDITGRTGYSAARLMNQESSIGQTEPALTGRREIHVSGGAAHPTAAYHPNGRTDEADEVVNGIARFEVAARRRDDDVDGFAGIRVQCDQPSGGLGRRDVRDRAKNENRS